MKTGFDIKNKYNYMALVIAIGLVVSVAITLLLMRPAWSGLKNVGKEIAQEELKRDQAKLDVTNLEAAKKFFEDNDSALQVINTAVPVQPQVPQILVMLESLARRNGVTLTSFVPQQVAAQTSAATPAAPEAAGTSRVEITAQYQAEYTALLSFFYNLERSQRIVDVKQFSTTARANGRGLEGAITFTSYYLAPPSVPTPGGTQ